ncbi:hypothetical protein [Desulfurobacterium sp.]
MVVIEVEELDSSFFTSNPERFFVFNGKVFLPDIVAERNGIKGKKAGKEVLHILVKNWNKLSRYFRLAVMCEFSLSFLLLLEVMK